MRFYNIEPIDVLFFRGNKLFGGPGDYSESQMPPWPSVFSGALRSLLISKDNHLWSQVHRKSESVMTELNNLLKVKVVGLRKNNKLYLPPPKDLIFFEDSKGQPQIEQLKVKDRYHNTSYDPALPKTLTLKTKKKPANRYWLSAEGLTKYLKGEDLTQKDVIHTNELWRTDYRLGIAMNPQKWSAEQGRIYTSDAVALAEDVSLVVGIDYGNDFPLTGTIRLGGDGRAAEVSEWKWTPPWMNEELLDTIAESKRFKMVLATPGIFKKGWLPDFVTNSEGKYIFKHKEHKGVKAQLMAAKVERFQVVSGWDLLKGRPKPAQRAVPAGCVYWFEVVEGKEETTKEALKKILETGLWSKDNGLTEVEEVEKARRAEGFNNVFFGVWTERDNAQEHGQKLKH